MASSISTDTTTLGALMRDPALLAVPVFQREYSWTSEEIEQLWDDLQTLRREGRKEHFLGAIVLNTEDADRVFVVDGQQRLATAFILFSVLRLRGRELTDDEAAEELQRRFGEKDLKTRKVRPKLQLNEADDRFFQEWIVDEHEWQAILTKQKDRNLPLSHKLLLNAFALLYEKAAAVTKTKEEFGDNCAFFVDALDKFLTVVKIEVTSEADAYWLFETLNDRGLDLSVSDLLKNYLLRQSGSYRAEAKKLWDSINSKSARTSVATFIRHHWLSNFGVVREKDLFRRVSKKFSGGRDILDFLKELDIAIDAYTALSDSSNSYWLNEEEPHRSKIAECIDELAVFRVTQCYPALLAAVQVILDTDDRLKAIKLITSVSVRFSIATAGRGSGSVEKAFSDLAQHIRQKKSYKRTEFLDILRSINPTDDEFKSAAKNFATRRKAQARHIIARVAMHEQSGLGDLRTGRTHSVEHILPQTPSGDWLRNFDGNPADYIHRLANITLIETALNKEAGRKVFEEKKEIYSKSALELNLRLGDFRTWDINHLEARGDQISKSMTQIWALS